MFLFVGSLLVRERPGIGTLAAATLGGVFIDLFGPIVPTPGSLATRVCFLLVGLVVMSFGGGIYRTAYRMHGISIGTILLIVLILWLFGVFGSRPF